MTNRAVILLGFLGVTGIGLAGMFLHPWTAQTAPIARAPKSLQRHLTAAQKEGMAKAFRDLGQIGTVAILHAPSSEAEVYAEDFRAALASVGIASWSRLPHGSGDYVYTDWTPVGLSIITSSASSREAVTRACIDLRIDADLSTVKHLPADARIVVWIGWNPHTYTPESVSTPNGDQSRQYI